MPFEVIHPSAFPARFGLARVPSKGTLKRWRQRDGFPDSLGVPRGHYSLEAVQQWFSERAAKASDCG